MSALSRNISHLSVYRILTSTSDDIPDSTSGLLPGEVMVVDRLWNVSNFQYFKSFDSSDVVRNVRRTSDIQRQRRLVHVVDCVRIMENNKAEIRKAQKITIRDLGFIPDETYANYTQNCDTFKHVRGYMGEEVLSDTERNFPIAFSILLYKDVEQAERLLRAIYRPNNIYCIHVDRSASPMVHQAVRSIAKCFHNVFISSKLEDVVYSSVSRLQADLNCMADLLKSKVPWKYFINTPSQHFPLKTNSELVKILTIYNGSNDIEGITHPDRMYRSRIKYKYVVRNGTIVCTGEEKARPPHNITIVKGSAYGVFSRQFVNFTLHNPLSKDLLAYLSDIYSPDEYYWSTLNHDKVINAPGGYRGVPDKKRFLAVYANWGWGCYGQYVRGICVYGLGDLSELVGRRELFANKFYYDFQPLALTCMEEWHRNKTFTPLPLPLHYYSRLPFVNRIHIK
ncbi:N-acetyllactosaminide beta-1,6-N-acetylglucosaminyl-transferase-like [Argopecten irradians]|uniref:N-acetyllactosaminide beta-1,6-N-acetylglucosaminyl-transferase-like n=1 Tax=Argopecten irradians TaxID=31199 RepID=UPI00371FB37A